MRFHENVICEIKRDRSFKVLQLLLNVLVSHLNQFAIKNTNLHARWTARFNLCRGALAARPIGAVAV
jgi:hypothetical protein